MRRRRLVRRPIPIFLTLVALATACDSTSPRGPGAIAVSSIAQSQDNFFEYGISIDDGTPRVAFAGQSLNFTQTGMAHGDHEVSVTGLPAACTGTGAKNVSLRGDDTAAVIFNIACPRVTGDINVTAATTGTDLDQNGYLVLINQTPAAQVPANGTSVVRFLQPGTYTVSLTDVATNCTLPPAQTVTLTAGGTPTVNFAITCAAVGVFKFVTSTAGADRDPDGLLVQIDNGTAVRLPANATTNVRAAIGTRTYSLSDIQPNCSSSATTGTQTLAAGDTVTVNATLTCVAIPMGTVGTTVSDPAADTLANEDNLPIAAYDILGVNARYTPGFLILVVRFNKAVSSPSTEEDAALYGYIDFDVDESAATGRPPLVNIGDFGGSSTQGVDYYLDFFLNDTASAQLVRSPSSTGGGFNGGRVRVRYEGDSLVVQLPLNKIGGDDGKLSVTMLLGVGNRPTDIASNSGQIVVQPPPAVMAARTAVRVREPVTTTPEFARPTPGTWRRKP
jgi:hypothetical protein